MNILQHPTARAEHHGVLPLVILPAAAGAEYLARLVEAQGDRPPVLRLNLGADVDEQLLALEEAARYLRTGDQGSARRLRHLTVVYTAPADAAAADGPGVELAPVRPLRTAGGAR